MADRPSLVLVLDPSHRGAVLPGSICVAREAEELYHLVATLDDITAIVLWIDGHDADLGPVVRRLQELEPSAELILKGRASPDSPVFAHGPATFDPNVVRNRERIECARLPRDRYVPRTARAFIDPHLRSWRCDGLLDDAALTTSELVTNAALHGSGRELEVCLSLGEQAVRVEVVDAGAATPVPLHPLPDQRGGRGLRIVAALSVVWGFASSASTTRTWADLPRHRV